MSRNLKVEISEIGLLAHAEAMLALIRSFPIYELRELEEKLGDKISPEHQRVVSKLWAAYLETGD